MPSSGKLEDGTPFWAVSNEELAGKPVCRPGQLVKCRAQLADYKICPSRHRLREFGSFLVYRCGKHDYIHAIRVDADKTYREVFGL